ncbi:MAG: ABC transporter permease, partial [Actinomycetes bacterium]
FSIIVAQRTRETALLRAVGAKRRQVLTATLLEAVIVGVIASGLGLLFGSVLAWGLAKAFTTSFSVQSGLPPIGAGTIAIALTIGVGVTVISAVFPAWRSTKIPPLAALSEVSVDRSDVSRRRLAWGLGLVAASLGIMALGLADLGPNPLWEVGGAAVVLLIAISLVLGPLIAAPLSRALAVPFAAKGRVVGRLAGENAARNPKRTAATAAALTIGVTLVTVITVIASSLQNSVNNTITNSLRADLVVNSTSFSIGSGIPANLAEQIATTPGVKVSSPVRFGPVRVTDAFGRKKAAERPASDDLLAGISGVGDTAPPGDDQFMLGVDPATIFEVLNLGTLSGSPNDLVPGTFVTTRKTADERGWKLGDEIPMFFARTGEQTLRLAVIAERTIGQASIYLPMATFEKVVPPGFNIDNAVYVIADSPASVPTVQRALNAIVAPLPTIKVQGLDDYAASQRGLIGTLLNVVYGLLTLAIIIALVGIANTLSMSILERTRELGLLRAVGMNKRQLKATIRLESAIIAVFGTLIGLVVGIGLSLALSVVLTVKNPDIFSFHLPVASLVVITVVGAIAGVLAALPPARRAARLDVLNAVASI